MEKQIRKFKIKNKYLLQIIFNYIEDKNFKYKFFYYSNYYKKLIGITLYDYQEKYMAQIGLDFEKYFNFSNEIYNHIYNTKIFDKNTIYNILNEDLLKYNLDLNVIQTFIIISLRNYIDEYKAKNNNDIIYGNSEKHIEIYSPFLDFLSKTEFFGEIFTISIPNSIILKYNLKNDFISAFEKLNKSKSKYSSIFFTFQFYRDIQKLKEFNIDFNNIKKLYIIQDLKYDDYLYSCYLKDFFSNKIIQNNLCFLYLEILCPIEPNLLDNLNKFKSLEHLDLNKIKFTTNFTLKVNNLKTLRLYHCKNIILDEKIGLKMKKLDISYSSITIPKKKLI